MVHSQVLVIRPKNSDLEEVMYPYQEVDKTQSEKLADDRCQFILEVPEKGIPGLVESIGESLEKKVKDSLEEIQFRAIFSCAEYEKKFNSKVPDYLLSMYINRLKSLQEYEYVKDLDCNNPRQIKFIKENGWYCTDKSTELYIPGIGYGFFDNPYQMWDFYTIIDEHRFPRGTKFLVGSTVGEDNEMDLDSLSIPDTLENIYSLTRFWRYIIFCEDNPKDSKVYTTDDIRFGDSWNKHCLVKDLPRVLIDLQEKNYGKDYLVTALDFHW